MADIVEVNGYDESGIIGKNLRFVRVGMTVENSLRPFVYNLLHFRSVSVTKNFLNGMDDAKKIDYVKKAMTDPAISINQYSFSTDHQIDILRQFTLLEEKSLYMKRGDVINDLLYYQGKKDSIRSLCDHLKRYERSPYWMESFIKAYGFRMIIEDLWRTSRIIADRRISNYKVISYVDGGFPFVFWWHPFLALQNATSRFSLQKTPIYGVTKGDEYYPTTSMAGNIAYITSTTMGMVYPHNIAELPKMATYQLNDFYNQFAETTQVPTFHKRVLFVGYLHQDFQYLLPFIMHIGDDYHHIYEPFRLQYVKEGTLKSFYRTFGKYTKNDIVVKGPLSRPGDKEISKECEDLDLDCHDAIDYLEVYQDLLGKIQEQSEASNLSIEQRRKIAQTINLAKQRTKESLQ